MTVFGVIGFLCVIVGYVVIYYLRGALAHIKCITACAALFILGGVLIAVGAFPANDMPKGSPAMVAVGFVCIIMGLLLVGTPYVLKGAKALIANRIIMVLIICTVLAIAMAFTGRYIINIYKESNAGEDNGYGNYGNEGSIRCPNCGTEYRERHPTAEFIEDHGYCPYCNGKEWGH